MWTTYNVLTDTNILASTRKRTRWNISFLVWHLVSWRKQESGVGSLFLYMNQPCRIVLSVQIRGAIEVKKPLNGVWLWELITQIEPIFSCKWHLTREPYTLPLRADQGEQNPRISKISFISTTILTQCETSRRQRSSTRFLDSYFSRYLLSTSWA